MTSGVVNESALTRENRAPDPSRLTDEAMDRQLARTPIWVSVSPPASASTGWKAHSTLFTRLM